MAVREAERELSVVMRIDNYDCIAAVYGVSVADEIKDAIRRKAAGLRNVRRVIVAQGAQNIRIDICYPPDADAGDATASMEDAVVEGLLYATMAAPLPSREGPLFVKPSIVSVSRRSFVEPVAPSTNADGGTDEVAESQGRRLPTHLSDDWRRSYREDMQRALRVYDALQTCRIRLAWQPVRRAATPDGVLYHECTACILDDSRQPPRCEDFTPVLDRLGMRRAFDCYVVQSVFEELRSAPEAVFAANISAQSACNDAWWHSLKLTLRGSPEVASRLVLEIGGAIEGPSASEVVDFIAEMRGLGCMIALDDFGGGGLALDHLIMLAPDMVKISPFFVDWAERNPGGQAGMSHMLNLLEAVAPIVVADGVLTQAQCAMLLSAGVAWQQGERHGPRSSFRPFQRSILLGRP